MFRTLLRGLSFANVCSFLALFIALSMGTAYAADTIFSTDIVDGEVKTADLADNGVTTQKIGNNQVYTFDVRDDTQNNGGLTAADLQADSVTSSEILDATITSADVLDGSLTGTDVASSSLTGSDILAGSIGTSDLATSSITGSLIASSAVTTSDIANRTVNMDDIDGADRSGSIDVGAIANGRCTTITGSVTGTEPGDAVVLTTNGSLPNGMTVSAQRALTDAVHIKVCNLTGATSAAITDLPVRVITIH
jgi:hypothetical protein